MKIITELKVRPYECDSYSHVNNAVYLNYLELARMDFLQKTGFDYEGCTKAGYSLYVTHVDIYYKFSAYMNETLKIESYPTKMGAVSGTFHQIITKTDGTVCAEADVSWASVNAQGRPSKMPAQFIVDGLKPETN
jgi:acyl-CoA thioester hydrolase